MPVFFLLYVWGGLQYSGGETFAGFEFLQTTLLEGGEGGMYRERESIFPARESWRLGEVVINCSASSLCSSLNRVVCFHHPAGPARGLIS